MMKEGGFGEAFDAFGDIFRKNRKLMITSVFVGLTTWLMLSSFNHIAERDNKDMIWTVSWRSRSMLSVVAVVVVVVRAVVVFVPHFSLRTNRKHGKPRQALTDAHAHVRHRCCTQPR